MIFSNRSRDILKFLIRNYRYFTKNRSYATKTSSDIRNEFLDFFTNKHGHRYVKSSPVVPFCDPTVPFVNSGMNQFKNVFLGKYAPPHKRVVNSQKCIRITGKHNDLDTVGSDGSHHTFFEMLGNWSFDDYHKEQACEMALNLLLGPYGFSRNSLIVTYFGGDINQGLEPDLETKEIWLKLGFSNDQIVACGMRDNFWEMGVTGPCGPCTEIHYRESNGNLIEIWNIVFIEYHRENEKNIVLLPKRHIDTGMGLERLTSLLQNKKSNYDTDLFAPLIDVIHKNSKEVPPYGGQFGEEHNIDKNYRILADHARMVSICLADEVYPCSNLRLRNALRKSILISKNIFKSSSNLMILLYDEVTKSLGNIYPELYTKMAPAKEIIMHEVHSVNMLENNIIKDRNSLSKKYPEINRLPNNLYPGFAEGYKQFKEEMKKNKDNILPGYLAFKLYDSFGLDENMIFSIASVNNLTLNTKAFKEHLDEHKAKHKAVFSKTANMNIHSKLNSQVEALKLHGCLPTNDSYKYNYFFENSTYKFPVIEAKLIAILDGNGDICDMLNSKSCSEYHLIFDKSNFYCEEGGQNQDFGNINFENMVFKVNSVAKIQGYILHCGRIEDNASYGDIKIFDCAKLSINPENRLSLMQHHTATHLLNAAVKKVLSDSVTCQLGSKVTPDGLSLDLGIYGKKLNPDVINEIQQLVSGFCSAEIAVETSIVDSQKLLNMKNVTTVPGEVYPETGLRLVDIKSLDGDLFSRELCCGTHTLSTKDVEDFAITTIRGAGGHSPTIRAVAGKKAVQINKLLRNILIVEKNLNQNTADLEVVQNDIRMLRTHFEVLSKSEGAPYGKLLECSESLNRINKKLKEENTKTLTDLVQAEIKTAVADNESSQKHFLVHFLACSYLLEPGSLTLSSALREDISKPVLILGCANGILKATCRVPKNCVNEEFNAEKWMSSIIPVFKTCVIPPGKNEDPMIVANMKGKKVSLINCESLVAEAIKNAKEYADKYLVKSSNQDEWQPSKNLNKKRDINN